MCFFSCFNMLLLEVQMHWFLENASGIPDFGRPKKKVEKMPFSHSAWLGENVRLEGFPQVVSGISGRFEAMKAWSLKNGRQVATLLSIHLVPPKFFAPIKDDAPKECGELKKASPQPLRS